MEIFAVFIYQDIGGCPLSISHHWTVGSFGFCEGWQTICSDCHQAGVRPELPKDWKGTCWWTVRLHGMGHAGFETAKVCKLVEERDLQHGHWRMLSSTSLHLFVGYPWHHWIWHVVLLVSPAACQPLPCNPAGLLINVLARLWKIQNFVWVAAPELGSGKC